MAQPAFVNSSTGGVVEFQPPEKPVPQIEGYSNLSLVKMGSQNHTDGKHSMGTPGISNISSVKRSDAGGSKVSNVIRGRKRSTSKQPEKDTRNFAKVASFGTNPKSIGGERGGNAPPKNI